MASDPSASPSGGPGSSSWSAINPASPEPFPESYKPHFLYPYFSPFFDLASTIRSTRDKLDLPSPGTVENLQREVKATHLSNYIFDGARADLTKGLSLNPAFQVTHSFSLGSQSAPPSYNFGAVFASANTFMQGGIDHEGSLTARFNQGWTQGHISKMQAQLSATPGQSMVQLEHDYQGRDHSANIKALNPSPADGTGIYIANFIQSLSRNIALGVETLYQRPTPDIEEATLSYLAKYTGDKGDWIATAQVQGSNVLQATYWQKLNERVEVGLDLQALAASTRREAVATAGVKYDFRMSTFRGQIDSTGKVSALLEQRFSPAFAFLVAGEIDHFKNAAKIGLGIMVESGGEPADPSAVPPTPPI